MAQRSPYNDRYKVDSKGKTRRSASAAKPKRAIADLTPSTSGGKKKGQAKTSFWSRLMAPPSSGGSAAAVRAIESTPRMKQLRRIWWVLWGGALLIAVGILYMQQSGMKSSPFVTVAWTFWLASMGGAFYIEFVPIRKERAAAIEAAKGGKSHKADKSTDSDKAVKSVKPAKKYKLVAKDYDPANPPSDDGEPPAPKDQA
jgi:hypothetical protein